MIPSKIFTATKALIMHEGKALILRESTKYADGANAGKYDVPGGRVEPGQRFDDSLRREILEETGLHAEIIKPVHVDEWRPVVKGEQWQIVGVYFLCSAKGNEVKLGQDHDHYEWINPEDAEKYNLIPGVINAFKALRK
jgi:8-oxo-dGTP diphosphatase